MVLAWILLETRLSFHTVVVVVNIQEEAERTSSSAAHHLLLLLTSAPLIVQCIQMHVDVIGGSIAVTLRLSMTLNGCSSSQAGMARKYVCKVWWSNSMRVELVIGNIGMSLSSSLKLLHNYFQSTSL